MAKVLERDLSSVREQVVLKQNNPYDVIKPQTINVLGLPFANLTANDMVDRIKYFVNQETVDNMFIVTANPEIAHYAYHNNHYQRRIKHADYIVPDGIGIVKAANYLNTPLKERIPGIELMEEMLNIANASNKRVFLLGSSKEGVKETKHILAQQYPNITFDYKHGYKHVLDHKVTKKIKAFNPDFIFVAMGFPKQEDWIYYNRHHFEHTVMMGVGGSFDVMSGNVKRAPDLFRKLNLEWFYRIITDLKRLNRALKILLFLKEVQFQKATSSKKNKFDYMKHR
ncbi:WecB/TagA/CpsF family glycosyltransferase [Mammaliicoccus stepanovicii]|uniref:N-acetylglucosaminyldiphosphoundecaprenol N-acetyl-beta-D-mannosaminyltransferase n=1 Tax=Mammaliicoccus stepanovicii TaxID=643214 RepID=A0A239ZRY4_9STAP|nr:WecB/TagA/CpsF family glycosyltransferase [Mammaliicoccus stepanovicii]PNZ73691.1 N-acetylmannosaminyltransferase [Mammaliicoccus stepanovicii]GGI43440.1 N-acetylmannosaminyltransferase [Mammaliicoccus stepanovicii]SNV73538.1 teichoic acid biosynthesis protein [Mammaliicoccus stepanovicii]